MRASELAIAVACALALGCPKDEPPAPKRSPAASPAPAGTAVPSPTAAATATATPSPATAEGAPTSTPPSPSRRLRSASRQEETDCVDRWLAARKLDPYGHPDGTMYAGGTPLFDERTGQSLDRLEYVYRRHPPAREACAPVRPPGE